MDKTEEITRVKIAGIALDPMSNTPIILLKEVEGNDAVPIWIGLMEASAIATKLEDIDLPRPMTHDLLKNIIEAFNAKVERVVVTDLRENTYYAEITIQIGERILEVDSRPSDAIALALRTESPIFIHRRVIEKSQKTDLSSVEKKEYKDEKEKWKDILEKMSPEDFGKYKM